MTPEQSGVGGLAALFPMGGIASLGAQSWVNEIARQSYNEAALSTIYKIEFNKCSGSAEHEFLVVRYGWGDREGCLFIDRSPEIKTPQKQRLYFPDSCFVTGRDNVVVSHNKSDMPIRASLANRGSTYRTLRSVEFATFPQPTILDLAFILRAVHELCHTCDTLKTQSYCYAGMIWNAILDRFEESARGNRIEKGSMDKGVADLRLEDLNPTDTLKSYDELLGKYKEDKRLRDARNAMMEEVDRQRVREEGRKAGHKEGREIGWKIGLEEGRKWGLKEEFAKGSGVTHTDGDLEVERISQEKVTRIQAREKMHGPLPL